MPKKRTVVLGGVGFIGSHLCRRLIEEGHEVFAIDIRDITHAPILNETRHNASFHYIHHNIIHPFGIRCDEIYNLAAPTMVHYNKALPVETLRVNMMGSLHALDTARSEHARVVLASTGKIYHYKQTATLLDCPTRRALIEGKLAAEALHRAYRQEFGVDTRIARIYNCYGHGADLMDQRVVIKWVVSALQNRDLRIEGNGEQIRTFCWVDDIVDGLLRLMRALPTDHTRTVNLGSDHEISILDLARRIVSLTGSRSQIIYTTARPEEYQRSVPDLQETRKALGWAPTTSLDEGLKRVIAYAEHELTERSNAFFSWVEVNN